MKNIIILSMFVFLWNPGPVGVKAESYSQNTVTGVGHEVAFENEVWDDYGFWDSSQPTRVTIPVSGRYSIIVKPQFGRNPNGQRFTYILKNGVMLSTADIRSPAGNYNTIFTFYGVYEFQAGDYIEVSLMQTSGEDVRVSAVITLEREK